MGWVVSFTRCRKFDLSTLRILGVLQRIAICYAIAAAIYLTTGVRGQIIWIVSLLAAFWLIMTFRAGARNWLGLPGCRA